MPGTTSAHEDGRGAPDTAAVLADRYGTAPPRHGRARTLTLAVLGGVLALGTLVMVALDVTAPRAVHKDVGFVLHGPGLVTVTFEVTTPPGTAARCRLVALDQGYGEVGVVDVDVPANEGRTLRQSVDVATVSLAVTGVVDSCSLVDD